MTRIGAYEAKTRLFEFLDRAEKGEAFEITKNGRLVARIVGAESLGRQGALAAAERMKTRLRARAEQKAHPPIGWDEIKNDIADEDDARTDSSRL